MIVVTNRLQVAKGFEAEFEERFKNRARLIDKTPGFFSNMVLKPLPIPMGHGPSKAGLPSCYLIQTFWESEEAFRDWTKSESFKLAHADRPPAEMFVGPNVVEVHKIIQHSEKA